MCVGWEQSSKSMTKVYKQPYELETVDRYEAETSQADQADSFFLTKKVLESLRNFKMHNKLTIYKSCILYCTLFSFVSQLNINFTVQSVTFGHHFLQNIVAKGGLCLTRHAANSLPEFKQPHPGVMPQNEFAAFLFSGPPIRAFLECHSQHCGFELGRLVYLSKCQRAGDSSPGRLIFMRGCQSVFSGSTVRLLRSLHNVSLFRFYLTHCIKFHFIFN